MTARAYVQDAPYFDGIRVALKPRHDQILHWPEGFLNIETYDLGTAPAVEDNSVWLQLPGEVGRALFEALAQYYGGSLDAKTMRDDLLHERQRVDDLIAWHLKRSSY